jgi:hypothetical protein
MAIPKGADGDRLAARVVLPSVLSQWIEVCELAQKAPPFSITSLNFGAWTMDRATNGRAGFL